MSDDMELRVIEGSIHHFPSTQGIALFIYHIVTFHEFQYSFLA